jgi:hypothetical protein
MEFVTIVLAVLCFVVAAVLLVFVGGYFEILIIVLDDDYTRTSRKLVAVLRWITLILLFASAVAAGIMLLRSL